QKFARRTWSKASRVDRRRCFEFRRRAPVIPAAKGNRGTEGRAFSTDSKCASTRGRGPDANRREKRRRSDIAKRACRHWKPECSFGCGGRGATRANRYERR